MQRSPPGQPAGPEERGSVTRRRPEELNLRPLPVSVDQGRAKPWESASIEAQGAASFHTPRRSLLLTGHRGPRRSGAQGPTAERHSLHPGHL
ncbi:hypothetical protein EYF80_020059 [Liparis tanakae]|uniref:Uncharacterized protein n=1 Tax=Liparis tanakae TaxID=230148 RepID=A0A4Z2HWI0_9TELE|nr:hypothetical protein EYF80_020059 [Liparis tanakae]